MLAKLRGVVVRATATSIGTGRGLQVSGMSGMSGMSGKKVAKHEEEGVEGGSKVEENVPNASTTSSSSTSSSTTTSTTSSPSGGTGVGKKRKERTGAQEKIESLSATGFNKLPAEKKRKLLSTLALVDEVTDALEEDMMDAVAFALDTHGPDVGRIEERVAGGVVEEFDTFLAEYAYVVVASGFKAEFAARVVPSLLSRLPDLDAMRELFKNKAKTAAIVEVAAMRPRWAELRASFATPDDLMVLPRIGPVVKFHLARNIGLKACVKPDVHMVSYAAKMGWNDPVEMIETLAASHNINPGVLDFCFWVWMSHDCGKPRPNCCHGGKELR